MIQCDEYPTFIGANLEQRFITRSLELLFAHSHYVVTTDFQQVRAPVADVLIYLDFHSCHMTKRNCQDSLP